MEIYVKKISQLREYIERHPSETTWLLCLDYDQLIKLITHAENLYNQQKKVHDNSKIRIIKAEMLRFLR